MDEGCEISDATIDFILLYYDVSRRVLEDRKGWYFVGEIGCGWWFSLLSPATFDRNYRFTEKIGQAGTIVERKKRCLSMSTDDAIFVQKRKDGKWAGQWGSMSAESVPDPEEAASQEVFLDLETLVETLNDAGHETEYGFRFPKKEPTPEIGDAMFDLAPCGHYHVRR